MRLLQASAKVAYRLQEMLVFWPGEQGNIECRIFGTFLR
jgi:hypothetical protein